MQIMVLKKAVPVEQSFPLSLPVVFLKLLKKKPLRVGDPADPWELQWRGVEITQNSFV